MTEFSYLDNLIAETNRLCKTVEYQEYDITQYNFSYMPTKKISFVGFKQGLSEKLIKDEKGLKETDKLRSTTKDYLRYIKDDNNELIQIECYNKGRLACLFQAYWSGNVRYLFPYSDVGGFYPTYTYVTVYEENRVVEEYMVNGNQIIHETYSENKDGETDYSFINYVSGGKHPVLEERSGRFSPSPLTYTQTYSDNWINHR